MPPRRTHKKSRNGCEPCKLRRVKCDERGPPCTNCVNRELPCNFSAGALARRQRESDLKDVSPYSSPYPAQPEPSRPASKENAPAHTYYLEPGAKLISPHTTSTRIREFELLHKYSTETYKSISSVPVNEYVWQVLIPRKAFSCDFLMNGLLALASLHIASGLEHPAAAAPYIDNALEYHTPASSLFRTALNNITPLNCEAVFAFSIITIVFKLSLSQLISDGKEYGSALENCIAIFELLRGVKGIIEVSKSWLEVGWFSSGVNFKQDVPLINDRDTELAFQKLRAFNDEMLAATDMNPEQEQQLNYNNVLLSRLEQFFSRFKETGDLSSVIAWLAFLEKQTISDLGQGERFALLAFMHWGVLLHQLDDRVWWAKGAGRAVVMELLSMLQPGDELADLTEWPRQQIGI
ncbi:hypothetical protein FQN57_003598 [Myotisia sp. PD_48]|nr:hypothetical protein FQN57_003598 [Myotisia sp. PD_48]